MTASFSVDDGPLLQVSRSFNARVLRIGGEIDTTNAADFEALVTARSSEVGMILDLGTVLYCDSAAFAALDRILAKGEVAVVLEPGNPVRRAAEIMGLRVHDSVEDAARALTP